jgi:serine/threonine-protein kinase RsbW
VHDPDRAGIELAMPATSQVIRLARLLASGIAAQARLDVDEVDDIRVAVDEMCSALLEVSDGRGVTLRFDTDSDGLEVHGLTSRRPAAEVDPDRFGPSSQILDVVVDEHRAELVDDTAVFWIRKRRRAGG